MKNNIFGELEYNFIWERDLEVRFMGSVKTVALMINGSERGDFEKGQYDSFIAFEKKFESIQEEVLDCILNYYVAKREELGFDKEINELYPFIETINELLDHVDLVGISVPYSIYSPYRYVGLLFDCSWDLENGLGVKLINEKVENVGYQDNVM